MSIKAPWTAEQVANLVKRQLMPLHPYTCPSHSNVALIPTSNGWICSECDYTQDWAHTADTEKVPGFATPYLDFFAARRGGLK